MRQLYWLAVPITVLLGLIGGRSFTPARHDIIRDREAAGTLGFVPGTPPLALARGTLHDLGTLGGEGSWAFAISRSGEVVGQSRTRGPLSNAFLYAEGLMSALPAPDDHSAALGINDLGHVVGWVSTRRCGTHAFLYRSGRMQDLGTLGGTDSQANAINDAGQVVGQSHTCGNAALRAFLWERGQMKDLGALGGTNSQAHGINNAGQVVGSAELGDVRTHAFLYHGGAMRDLGTLGGGQSSAHGINDRGVVVGTGETVTGAMHAFLYRDNRMEDLGTLGGRDSRASGINALGQVVGTSHTAAGRSHAFFYEGGEMTDLNQWLPADCGWVLESATAINDRGQIVGKGVFRGQARAYLLAPASSPKSPTNSLRRSVRRRSGPGGSRGGAIRENGERVRGSISRQEIPATHEGRADWQIAAVEGVEQTEDIADWAQSQARTAAEGTARKIARGCRTLFRLREF